MNAVPDIRLAYGPGGARFKSAAGTSLVARAREDGTITISVDGPGQPELVGTVRPVAGGAGTAVTWHPRLAAGADLETRACWEAAARSVAVHAPSPGPLADETR